MWGIPGEVAGGAFALLSAAMWAVASVLWARLGLTVSPQGMNLGKGIVALAFLCAGFAFTGFPDADPRAWAILSLSGVVGIAAGDTAYLAALMRLGPRRMLVLTTLVPLAASLLAIVFLGERPGPRWAIGAALCVGGVAIVLRERLPADADRGSWRAGVLLGVVTVACEASGIFLSKVGVEGLGSGGHFGATFIRLLAAVVVLAAVGLPGLRVARWLAPLRPARSLGTLVVASFVGTFLGIWLSMAALAYTDVAVASVLNSTSPLFVLPIWAIVSGERPSGPAVLGAIAAVAGVAVLMTGGA
ncbi:MAG: DMT family transporter [Deltaproteobacteria bacterium]|nr:DMT family transporter [Deltaproteobacteria bacterium]